ncbi:hypothetical protein BD311DRAFT_868253 [Dichomitus squalens]|uniref:Uncharacterized protein n=1 Tax=Dichomitus squalens TaxID=114155 RepID=A0A4Q9MCH5_9APHY|nr:hypothetical protein BD311DRAFT_868253 [Dichomitus squalens]
MSLAQSLPPCPPHSSLAVHALVFVLSHPYVSSLSLRDIAVLARTCTALKSLSDNAFLTALSHPPHSSILGPMTPDNPQALTLSSPRAIQAFAAFAHKSSAYRPRQLCHPASDGSNESQHPQQCTAHDGVPDNGTTSSPGYPFSCRAPRPALSLPLRRLTIDLHPSQLSSSLPLLRILQLCSPTLTHLRITHTDALLAHDADLSRALPLLSNLTSLAIHGVGPRGCTLLGDLKASLQEAQVDFDDDWVHSVICASYAKRYRPPNFAPALTNPSGPPPPTPALAVVPLLPDPVLLLENSMLTLRTMRSSNAIIVTVADKIRYPAVRTLALRLAGVPTVIPLVHAFPALRDLYVYTPFDGCGLRAPPPQTTTVADATTPPSTPPSPGTADRPASPNPLSYLTPRRMRPPMPCIHATRETNRTSQVYSSFPPLLSVRGFAPGLYALGLTCTVRRFEVGSLTPPSEGAEEAWAVRTLLADIMPTTVTIGLGRGWWAPGTMQVRGKDKTAAKGPPAAKGRAKWKGKERDTGRDGLKSIFGGDGVGEAVWAGVSELVLRVEEPGRWEHVTRDILAMLIPLANTLTTFVLHWDRTSVPFDRVPLDDDQEDDDDGQPGHAPHGDPAQTSRAEAFARRVAEQLPLLRYMFIEILHDELPGPASAQEMSRPPQPWGTRRYDRERRFFRVERAEGWLCLDPLSPGMAETVMADAGLSFVDQVRYT